MKIGKTHPALRQRFQRGNKYHFFSSGAILHSLTPARSMYFCHNELSCLLSSRPRIHPCPSPQPLPSSRLRTLSSPDHRPSPPNIKADCCISPTPSPIGRCIVVAVSSPRSSVDCCFDPRTRLMLPPMASSSMSAAAVVFRRYRPMPLSPRCRLRC